MILKSVIVSITERRKGPHSARFHIKLDTHVQAALPHINVSSNETQSDQKSSKTYGQITSYENKPWFIEDKSKRVTQALRFRYWHDEKRFKGTGETSLAQRALNTLGGQRMGGNVKSDPVQGPLGWQRKDDWDILWSPATTAHKAFEGGLRPGQLCSAVPGTQSICKKRRLSETLVQAYGEKAFDIIPRTYSVPRQVKEWREWMLTHCKGGEAQLWMLKTAQHLGKGLKLVPYQSAIKEVLLQFQKADVARKSGRAKQVRPFVVAQRYVEDPMLINGLKFGIRVWVLITSVNPLRVYMHSGGLVLFSTDMYSSDISRADGSVAGGHVTNYAQNKDGEVWDMKQLRRYLGDRDFDVLMNRILHNTAMTYAAALEPMRREASKMGRPAAGCSSFELMGLDFLVDSSLNPWLLEVNSTPSLAVEHSDPEVEGMIYHEKNSMVMDIFKLLRIPERFSSAVQQSDNESSSSLSMINGCEDKEEREALVAKVSAWLGEQANHEAVYEIVASELEMRAGTGFVPLMNSISLAEAEASGWNVTFSQLDLLQERWCQAREQSLVFP
ncbi:hypothetical protein CEUSTIGMA_g3182.t1 [Chlamydomonas eustigma]|uniref:Tubulin--tyrosine ligase-like protein 5 n=1 Tax=Chlamydomonas eustigma TaxID=1157962 RepID=A0A250WYG5_9CHLO|nr:hypothetical protein CEUSTIGMA_g3182.t1 [Chlamydomonas eustigma]|eukprot:GAX75739.1 hypothetical protein CEUSTIGMA_g3182.t1 [Chlamydomonas eustigma]